MEKRERGSNIIYLKANGKNFKGEEGKGTEVWGIKSRSKKNGGGKEYQVVRSFIHPCEGGV